MTTPDKIKSKNTTRNLALAAVVGLGAAACASHAPGEGTVVSRYAFVTKDYGWPHLNFCGLLRATDDTPEVFVKNNDPAVVPYKRLQQQGDDLVPINDVPKPFPAMAGNEQPALFARDSSAKTNWTHPSREIKLGGVSTSLVCVAGYQKSMAPERTDDRLVDFPVTNDPRKVQDLPDGTVVEVGFDTEAPLNNGFVQLGDIQPSDVDIHIKTVTVLP